jgi:chromosome segregation ATPase
MDPFQLISSVGGACAVVLALVEALRRWRNHSKEDRRDEIEVQGIELANLSTLQDVWSKQFSAMRTELDAFKAEVTEVATERDVALAERDVARRERDEFHAEIQTLRAEVVSLRSEVAQLRTQT